MKVAVPKERREGETRVAASPETVKKMVGLGLNVTVESGAGANAAIPDDAYKTAGATIEADGAKAVADADIVLKVQRPLLSLETGVTQKSDELKQYKQGAVLIGTLNPYDTPEAIAAYAEADVVAFAMELMPRITRAQSMDILSSQSNLAGYKAVLDAAAEFPRAFPQMMTAAGTVPPASVMVMGAGVAGLQAIATARRLGARVVGTDVRPAAKEQVESLGAKFVAVEDEEFKQAEAAGGYAKEMSKAYQEKQQALIAETIKKQDIVICTALIPGRPAPTLVTKAMVESMKPGSVVVDLAVERGGNCPLSKPGKVVEHKGVKIVGHTNVPGRLAADSSLLYARNLFTFLQVIVKEGALHIDPEDEVIKGTLLTRAGAVVHDRFKAAAEEAAAAAKAKTTKSGGTRSRSTKKDADGADGTPDADTAGTAATDTEQTSDAATGGDTAPAGDETKN